MQVAGAASPHCTAAGRSSTLTSPTPHNLTQLPLHNCCSPAMAQQLQLPRATALLTSQRRRSQQSFLQPAQRNMAAHGDSFHWKDKRLCAYCNHIGQAAAPAVLQAQSQNCCTCFSAGWQSAMVQQQQQRQWLPALQAADHAAQAGLPSTTAGQPFRQPDARAALDMSQTPLAGFTRLQQQSIG